MKAESQPLRSDVTTGRSSTSQTCGALNSLLLQEGCICRRGASVLFVLMTTMGPGWLESRMSCISSSSHSCSSGTSPGRNLCTPTNACREAGSWRTTEILEIKYYFQKSWTVIPRAPLQWGSSDGFIDSRPAAVLLFGDMRCTRQAALNVNILQLSRPLKAILLLKGRKRKENCNFASTTCTKGTGSDSI